MISSSYCFCFKFNILYSKTQFVRKAETTMTQPADGRLTFLTILTSFLLLAHQAQQPLWLALKALLTLGSTYYRCFERTSSSPAPQSIFLISYSCLNKGFSSSHFILQLINTFKRKTSFPMGSIWWTSFTLTILAHTNIKNSSVYRYQKIFIYTLSLVDSIEIRKKVNWNANF